MPRYDDRYGNSTRLYVGHLSSRTRSRDLEHLFSRYGRVRDVDMKQDFAFVDFSDPRDADDAIYNLHGREVDGRRIVVEFAKGVPRGPGGVRDSIGRGPTPGTGRCFNCGIDGHWARDCTSGDWKNKCYRCGERGHVERNCKSSPKKKPSRGRSYSRSPVRSRSPRRGGGHGRSYSRSPSRSYSRGRSYSRSRSPLKRKPVEREDRRSRSRSYSRSPDVKKEAISIPKSRKRSLTPDEVNEIRGKSHSPEGLKHQHEETRSRGWRSERPEMEEKGSPAGRRYDDSPSEANGNSRSPSPRAERSPAEDIEEQRTPRGSESS